MGISGTQLSVLVITIFKNNFHQCVNTLNSLVESGIRCHVVLQNGGERLTTEEIQSLQRFQPIVQIHLVEELDYGIYDAMNKALNFALQRNLLEISEWVWFLNSGDMLASSPNQQKLKGFVGITDSKIKFGEPTFGLEKQEGNSQKIDEIEFLSGAVRLNHQAVLFHKSIFAELGQYKTSYKITSDYQFIHRTLRENTYEYIDSLRIIVEPGGISQKRIIKVEIEKIRYLLWLFVHTRKSAYFSALKIRGISLMKYLIKSICMKN